MFDRFGSLLIVIGSVLFLLSFVPVFKFSRPKMLCGWRREIHFSPPPPPPAWIERPIAPCGLFLILLGLALLG